MVNFFMAHKCAVLLAALSAMQHGFCESVDLSKAIAQLQPHIANAAHIASVVQDELPADEQTRLNLSQALLIFADAFRSMVVQQGENAGRYDAMHKRSLETLSVIVQGSRDHTERILHDTNATHRHTVSAMTGVISGLNNTVNNQLSELTRAVHSHSNIQNILVVAALVTSCVLVVKSGSLQKRRRVVIGVLWAATIGYYVYCNKGQILINTVTGTLNIARNHLSSWILSRFPSLNIPTKQSHIHTDCCPTATTNAKA
jgi:hypothetical protein